MTDVDNQWHKALLKYPAALDASARSYEPSEEQVIWLENHTRGPYLRGGYTIYFKDVSDWVQWTLTWG